MGENFSLNASLKLGDFEMISHGQILAVFFTANDSELLAGSRFYSDALAYCQQLSRQYGCSVEYAAGVIAALSPNNNWERNQRDANTLIRAFYLGGHADANSVKVSTYSANKIKALSILSGSEPLSVLGGLKVRAFYDCIIGGDSVCVDGHAYSIWTGERIPTTKTPKISPKLYAAITADYRLAANQINRIMAANYSARQIQAITWLTWRRIIKEAGA
jgi:hypothetical protein